MRPTIPSDADLPETIQEVSRELRGLGELMKSEALLEDDLETAQMIWANSYLLEKTGYSLPELTSLRVDQILPTAFHEELAERRAGKRGQHYIFPFIAKGGSILWWLAQDLAERGPRHWSKGRLLHTTKNGGSEYDILAAMMAVANIAGERLFDHEARDTWFRGELQRIDTATATTARELRAVTQQMSTLSRKVDGAASASRDAANNALQAHQRLADLESHVKQAVKQVGDAHATEIEKVSTEILRLISADSSLREDLDRQLRESTRRATDSIRAAGKDAGKAVTFKVTFPLGVIGSLLIIVQQLLDNPEILAKLLMWAFG
jgi:hypothetical protein